MQQSKVIHVSVPEQKLRLISENKVIEEYPVSTSKFGLGTEEGSYRTPLGRFCVCEKIGHEAPLGTCFKGRKPVGTWSFRNDTEEDMVLTRIMWLDGCDDGNANTRERYVYIHGTNDEQKIGAASSHGCVRMRNADIIQLFDSVDEGIEVIIEDSSLHVVENIIKPTQSTNNC